MTLTTAKVNRREFLKMLGAAASFAFLPLDSGDFMPHIIQPWINTPPSLMLHSSDGSSEFLPRLLECLHRDGFTATTYRAWYQGLLTNNPISNPVIISIDDISLAKSSCGSFKMFVQMKDWIKAAGATAVFGVITQPVIAGEPQREQDEARWNMMQAWVEEGFELSTHTTYHSNFNALDSGPRPDFIAADYDAEIVQSAQLIETKLRERQIDYKVETLILPYGSGYSYQLPQPEIHAGIVDACHKTNIKFVVGIPHGRGPVSLESINNPQQLIYVGRIPPVYITDLDGRRCPQAEQTAAQLQLWQEKFHRVVSPSTFSTDFRMPL